MKTIPWSATKVGLRSLARTSLIASACMATFAMSAARAEAIRIIVPTPAGAALDTLARLLSDQIGHTQQLTIVVDNRPGASTQIGTEAASRAAPDGNTLLFAGTNFVINSHLRQLRYDPLTSFEAICKLVTLPTVIVANSKSPYHTLTDLLNGARRRPGELTLASIGPGSTAHIAFEMLKRKANVDMTFVPYPGPPGAVTALLGQQVTSFFGNYADVSEQLNAGRLRALASASPNRIEPQPNLPTLADLGYAINIGEIWFGVVAPAGTSKDTLARFARWFSAALQAPEVKKKLVGQGIYPAPVCGPDFSSFLRGQFDEYGRAVRETGIKAN